MNLEVDDYWPYLPRLLYQVRSVKGIRGITINGRPAPEPAGTVAPTSTSTS